MSSLAGKTVLLVDDEPDIREIFKDEILMRNGKVLEASSGQEAFEILSSPEGDHVSVILSDIRMPGGDGIELMQRVKARDPKRPPIFLITGYSEHAHLATQANGLFNKPFDLDVVLDALEKSVL
jgi:CheY-like chemotaxis protein